MANKKITKKDIKEINERILNQEQKDKLLTIILDDYKSIKQSHDDIIFMNNGARFCLPSEFNQLYPKP